MAWAGAVLPSPLRRGRVRGTVSLDAEEARPVWVGPYRRDRFASAVLALAGAVALTACSGGAASKYTNLVNMPSVVTLSHAQLAKIEG